MNIYENEYEHEPPKTIADRNYLDGKDLVDLYDVQALQELVLDGICPECGSEVELTKGDHTIMIKAECTSLPCEFGFVDIFTNVDNLLKSLN